MTDTNERTKERKNVAGYQGGWLRRSPSPSYLWLVGGPRVRAVKAVRSARRSTFDRSRAGA